MTDVYHHRLEEAVKQKLEEGSSTEELVEPLIDCLARLMNASAQSPTTRLNLFQLTEIIRHRLDEKVTYYDHFGFDRREDDPQPA